MRAFAFLDRDGTLVEDRGYHFALRDYAPLPGAYEAVRLLNAAGIGTAVITNQSGIGRGYFGEDDLARFHAHLVADFAAHGARIDALYHCGHRPDDGCDCRKPRTGLLLRAVRDHAIDLAASWVLGDADSDVLLAQSAGCAVVQIARVPRADGVPIAATLLEAVQRFVLPAQR
jgi:D-glycero-D-manno-heptose 1,7-bisphosphate phosphatase